MLDMLDREGQGATEYLLMLAAVLVIVAVAVYYVTSATGFPTISATAAIGDESDVTADENDIVIDVTSGSIVSGEWQVSVTSDESGYDWETVNTKLEAPGVNLDDDTDISGSTNIDNKKYVSLKHKDSGHIYFSFSPVEP